MKKAVFLGSHNNTLRVYAEEIRQKLSDKLEFVTDKTLSRGELAANAEILRDVEYIFSTWGMFHMTKEEIFDYFPKARAVFYGAGSVQHFAREFIESGIAVFSAWAANGVPVAEFTFAEIMLAAKGYYHRIHRASDGPAWDNRRVPYEFDGIYEINVGIIGAGMIGKMVINKLKTLDKITIYVFDPFLSDDDAEKMGVVKTDLHTLFEKCSVISNHLANNPQTVGMIDSACFNRMKKNGAFINTGRGAQVVEADMIAALKEEPMRIAILDVTFPEPPAPDSELYTLNNVILTPHIAGSIGNEVHRMGEYMYEEFVSFDAGMPTRYSVSLKMLETMA